VCGEVSSGRPAARAQCLTRRARLRVVSRPPSRALTNSAVLRRAAPLGQQPVALRQPRGQRLARGTPEQPEPLLAALAQHAHAAAGHIHIAQVEPAALLDAQAGRVQRLEHGAIAQAGRLVGIRRVEQALDRGLVQRARQRAAAARRAQCTVGSAAMRPPWRNQPKKPRSAACLRASVARAGAGRLARYSRSSSVSTRHGSSVPWSRAKSSTALTSPR